MKSSSGERATGGDLLRDFERHLAGLGLAPGRALVAVSGGPDSVTLLDLLHRTAPLHRLELIVAHLDHGIDPRSALVAEQVRSIAAGLGLRCVTGALHLGPEASETSARSSRYRWLADTRRQVGARWIVTAHHADDQVETVLMRVLGGSGPAGLAGMASASGVLVRPLLPFRREALVSYARARGLPFWSDPANQDPRHLRSWIRSEMLPTIRHRLPAVDAKLLRVARQAARDRAAWEKVLDLLPGLDLREEREGISVAGGPLRGYDSALTEAIVIALGRRAGCRIGARGAVRVRRLLASRSGATTPLPDGWTAELTFGRLRLAGSPERQVGDSWVLRGSSGERNWRGWRIRWRLEPAPERQQRAAFTAWFSPEPLTVRVWRAGDKIRPLAASGRRLAVRCFQEARVPRSLRPRWPIVSRAAEVVWIPGVCRSDALLPARGAEALRIDAELT